MQQKMRQLQRDKDPELKKILTPEQWEKLMEWRKQNPGGYGPGNNGS
jgi:Spy/CpxP family protein refolding chaperone